MTAVRTLAPDSAVAGPSGLRVAWFGHAEGRRADGLSAYSRAVVSTLSRAGVETMFFSHAGDGSVTPVDAHVSLSGVRFKTVTWSAPGSLRRVSDALQAFRPDVVHVSVSFSLMEGTIAALARMLAVPAVATVHLPYAAANSARGRVLRGLYRFHARHLAVYDRVIALSDGQRELLAGAGCRPERITVVHNGVDTDAITPGESGLRGRLGAELIVAYLGRLDPEKRVASLARSFLELGWPDDHLLLIAGAGNQVGRIGRLVAGNQRVRLLGMVDAAARLELLRATDIFVLPSTAEGLSLSLLEGMAAGCAVVATDVGEDGAALGDAGILLPVHPLEPGLSLALRRLAEDPALRTTLGRRARARVEQRYSLRANVERLLGIYSTIVSRRQATG